MSNERIKIAVYMDVTVPQALAIQAMFRYWNTLSGLGGSRRVGFYADGDGNFHPNCEFVNLSTKKLPKLTDELYQASIVEGKESGDYTFDFDPIAWMIHEEKRKWEEEAEKARAEGSKNESCCEKESCENEEPLPTSQ
jgi:hypothetical protein